ncbi:NAD(P)-dependent dehydrogenase (short-subunit alcohol dehydrogenase family) [Tamaricihabitans halophyticus]|uniref:NAD(P)-dependent dehydrogenase (Short-subunit alcohol dehydrogenase family) n=1 Tax=Tamaricihabitans halophyticus TaxID=1262583 RepID=A0A4R2QVV9_9PSEU|nr:SDR family NAD(P)-dependent oxidoreductase [Tamaricihabitans halophyticus]TCP54232.1 NAD(P)-dependent dehydrogenase (short-subunit alcohol dehydrogenase family) [Tamaricihabitans halophyticus]
MTTSRTCLVTGASRGIGRSVALALAAEGHRVAINARERAALGAVEGELAELGRAELGLAVPGDVTQPGAAETTLDAVERRWGAVEVLVLAAGVASSAPLARTTDAEWERTLAVNLTAPFQFLKRAAPVMAERGWGRIVVIASMAAKRGDPYVSAYTASKHGVLGLVRSAATELARSGVTVNAVCPGYVDTQLTADTIAGISASTGRSAQQAREALERMHPIRRLITPDEVAEAVLACVRNPAMTGQGINVDGGACQS